MPEHIRAFIVILTLSTIGLFVAKKLFQTQVTEKEFSAWRNIWFVSTTIAFLSGNFWIYALITSAYIHFIFKKVDNKISIFFIFFVRHSTSWTSNTRAGFSQLFSHDRSNKTCFLGHTNANRNSGFS